MVKIDKTILVVSLLTLGTIAAMSDIKKDSQAPEFFKLTGDDTATLCTIKIFTAVDADPLTFAPRLQDYLTAAERASIKIFEDTGSINPNKPAEVSAPESKNEAQVIKDTGVAEPKKDVVEKKAVLAPVEDKNKQADSLAKSDVKAPAIEEKKDTPVVNSTGVKTDGVAATEPQKNAAEKVLENVKEASEPILSKAKEAIAGEQPIGEYGIAIECFSPKKGKSYERFTYEGKCSAPGNQLRVMYIEDKKKDTPDSKSINIEPGVDGQMFSYFEKMKPSSDAGVSFVANQCTLTVSSVGMIAVFVSILALLY